MKRRLFTILSAVSLLLSAVVIDSWIGSYRFSSEFLRLGSDNDYYTARSTRGWITFFQMPSPLVPTLPSDGILRAPATAPTAVPILSVPHGAILGVLLVAPGIQACIHLRRRKLLLRQTSGQCLQCGYDLRASRDQCPECGTPIPADLVRKPVS